ncbi:endonuclease domain-containing protein [Sphingobium sp. AN558]|uniref:endonuclease domain-containing protein n=1 Tax=Sphingobium sp. AN558 TaxID=3133442 RepID=UPI0030C2B962
MRLDAKLKVRARYMRANPTPAERILWLALRANRFENRQFTRQTIIAPYIVDFASKSARLVIEIDGDTHFAEDRYDAQRTEFLESLGYKVVRFANHDVMRNLEGVLSEIARALRVPPLPTLSPGGEGFR